MAGLFWLTAHSRWLTGRIQTNFVFLRNNICYSQTYSNFKVMKKAFIFLFILTLGLFSYAQEEGAVGTALFPIDINSGLLTFQEVVEESGTKKDLFNRAGEWLHVYFKQPVYVTNVRDAATGLIKGKHQFELWMYDADSSRTRAGMIKYYFKIECKEGRYRWTLDNFVLTQQSRYGCERWLNTSHRDYNDQWAAYLAQLRAYAYDDFAASLKKHMVPEVIIEEEEW